MMRRTLLSSGGTPCSPGPRAVAGLLTEPRKRFSEVRRRGQETRAERDTKPAPSPTRAERRSPDYFQAQLGITSKQLGATE
jgi:hypothetical protein